MERLTKLNENRIEVNDIDEALKKLKSFEDFYFDLVNEQELITEQMKKMQENFQTKQYRYRELSSQKVTNQLVLSMLKKYDIK